MKAKAKFIYNGLLLTAVGLAMRGTQLLFGAFIARQLGAEGVGINSLVMTVYSFALTLATSGISLTVTRLVAEAQGEGRGDEVGRLLVGASIYAAFFGSLSTALLLLLSRPLGLGVISSAVSVRALYILSLSLVPSALSAVIAGYFVAVRRVTLNAVTQVASQLLRIALTFVFLTRGGSYDPISGIALGVTLSELAAFLIALPEILIDRRHARRAEGASLRPVAKMAFPLAVSAYIRSALLTLEHNLIPRRLERHGEMRSEALASYGYLHGMALPLILYPMTPLSSFSGLLVPEFAEAKGAGKRERMESIASRALNTTLTYAVAASVLIYLFSEELGLTVYASGEAGRFIAILAPVVPIMYLDHVADSILKGIGEHIYSMWVNIADAVLSVVLVVILIPVMGIAGYAVVIIGMEAFNFILSVLRLRTRVAFRIDLIGSVLLPLLAALGAAAIASTAFSITGSAVTPWLLALELTFAACAFIALLTVLRAICSLLKIKPDKKGSARI